MTVDRLKRDALAAAQSYKNKYKSENNPEDLELFKRLMDVYFHLDDLVIDEEDLDYTIDYNDSITGVRDGVNNTFSTSQVYISGSIRVFVNGLRQTEGSDYDFEESAGLDAVVFTFPIAVDDVLLFEYRVS